MKNEPILPSPVSFLAERRAPNVRGGRRDTDQLKIGRWKLGSIRAVRERIAMSLFVVLLFMSIIGDHPLSRHAVSFESSEGDSFRQAVYLMIFLILLATSELYRRPAKLLAIPLTLSVLLLWCYISLSWSAVPGIAARRLMLTTIIMWIVFRSVDEMGYTRAITATGGFLIFVMVANYIAVATTPLAIHQVNEAGDNALVGCWRGVLNHKNWTGALCAVTVLFFCFDAKRWPLVVRAVMVVGSAYFLYRTHSKTSAGILCAAILVGIAFQIYQPRYRVLLLPFFAVLFAALVFYLNLRQDALVSYFTNPQSLTGRGSIWAVLIDYAKGHLLFGTGFGSFWNIGPTSPVFDYNKGWVTTEAAGHNGYLDLLVTIGVPGLVMAVSVLLLWPLTRLLASPTVDRSRGALLISILIFCAGHNSSESSMMDRDMMMQLFLMLDIALIHRVIRRSLPKGARTDLFGRAAGMLISTRPADRPDRRVAAGGLS